MKKGEWLIGLALAGLAVSMCGGCVSLDTYRQLEMSNKTLAHEKAQIESELYDARTLSDSLRTKLTGTESELGTKSQLVANLQDENDKLDAAFAIAQETLKKLADRGMPTDPVIITESKLPEALDSALTDFATQYPSDVEYDEATGAIKWKSDLLFALSSDAVKETAMASLGKFSEILNSAAAADFEVVVVGHTDDRPIARASTKQFHPTNWHLSVHRAISVAYIIMENGYDATRIGLMGYGEYRPIASNDDEENRARNRRVEIYLIARGSGLTSAQSPGLFFAPDLQLVFAKASE